MKQRGSIHIAFRAGCGFSHTGRVAVIMSATAWSVRRRRPRLRRTMASPVKVSRGPRLPVVRQACPFVGGMRGVPPEMDAAMPKKQTTAGKMRLEHRSLLNHPPGFRMFRGTDLFERIGGQPTIDRATPQARGSVPAVPENRVARTIRSMSAPCCATVPACTIAVLATQRVRPASGLSTRQRCTTPPGQASCGPSRYSSTTEQTQTPATATAARRLTGWTKRHRRCREPRSGT